MLLTLHKHLIAVAVTILVDPDLECYANRILYVADGRIVGMAINESQSALEYDAYMKYLQVEEG